MQISKKQHKIIRIVSLSLLGLLFIGSVVAFSKREALLNTAIKKAINKADKEYDLILKIESVGFAGLSTVSFKNITVIPRGKDSLARIINFRVGVKLFPLIFGDIKLSEIKLERGFINLVKKDSLSNFDFLFRKKNKDVTEENTEMDLGKLANNLINQLLYKIPDDMDIRDFEIKFRDDSGSVSLFARSASIDGGDVKSTILVNGNESVWHMEGSVDPGDKQLDLKLFADNKKVELPYLEKRFGLKLNFDLATTEIRGVNRSGGQVEVNGSWRVKNLLVNHRRIAGNDIIVPDASLDADMVFGKNFIAIDSTSTIHLKNIQLHPFIKYTVSPSKIYELKLHTEELDAQELMNSFPIGLFESLEGIEVAGKLQYDLNFYLDSQNPDSVLFNSRLKNEGFKVLKWGKTNLQKINSTFVYTPYEYGKPMRDIIIGPENPNFVSINQISPYLKNALLTAEDPSFYSHNGFVEASMRSSIITNFKAKAFKRGGSTISMQLAKNVYLNRQKTLARKIEEILIVWIMENGKLSSKQRMFETYLNLIEWGNNVYGIGEATRYYFDKHPSELTLGEGIFLASIVPRPKSGLYRFEGDGSLRSGLSSYFNFIGGIMARRGMTEVDSTGYGFWNVRLKESLRAGIPTSDSLIVDRLMIDEESEDKETILQEIFGRKRQDTVQVKEVPKVKIVAKDTILTKIPSRKERREVRKNERDSNNKSQ
ncbi:MAG: transglycosylase domain-containing protein [Sphingobacterium thalpophilum]